MAKLKNIFVCSNCAFESGKWQGRCPNCGEWNTFAEEVVEAKRTAAAQKIGGGVRGKRLQDVTAGEEPRMPAGIGELDRVLGGGFVKGSVVLLGGDPGIGKSTLLLECCDKVQGLQKKVLYVTGEESAQQIKLRAQRLQLPMGEMEVLAENDVDRIISAMEGCDFVVIDSIQTVSSGEITSAVGSVSQIRECSSALIRKAKAQEICMILIGHVTKDGAIAGPKVLEHMVDTVLYFEGERHQLLRILRTRKNRFGSTNEIGVFEMTDKGMEQVLNPSFIGESGEQEYGCAVVCAMEGTRPILIEVQALLTTTVYGQPRRMAAGFDYNRLVLLLAVLEKKLRLPTGKLDCYINVAGGLDLDGPDADLGVVAAIVSAIREKPIPKDIAFMGEVGLTGEVRFVNGIDQRIAECKKMGMKKLFVPRSAVKGKGDASLVPVGSLRETFGQLFRNE